MIQAVQARLPQPIIKPRAIDKALYQQALDQGLEPLVARILASRVINTQVSLKTWLNPTLKDLSSPEGMADIKKSTERLIQALKNQEVIALETDHDCDGQTSHAVLYLALTQWFNHPKEKVLSYIGHRMQEGYGLSEPLVERILASPVKPSLVITADNGSSDEPRIKTLKSHGIDVIVTDHHAIPQEGIPASAYAVLNPTRDDCQYPDPLIAGCMVAWLYMAWTRTQMISQGLLDPKTPSLGQLLDFVAVGTVADCVSLSRSLNNRIVTRFGMNLISKFQRPCWRAVRDEVTSTITSEDIGFRIAPLLNSDGRLQCAFSSVSFLLSESDEEALNWVRQLVVTNQERKGIQKKITQDAMSQALEFETPSKKTVCVYLDDGHAGVHGISASRLKDTFGKPVFIFSPKATDETLISGSGRSIDECHLREALQSIDDNHPGIMEKFGGHSGAAGVTLYKEKYHEFAKAFEQAVSDQVDYDLHPILLSDGTLSESEFNVEVFKSLQAVLEPFGREFDAPVFEVTGVIENLQWMGAEKNHARFFIKDAFHYNCVWFNARENQDEEPFICEQDSVHASFTLQVDTYRYPPSLKCFIQSIRPI